MTEFDKIKDQLKSLDPAQRQQLGNWMLATNFLQDSPARLPFSNLFYLINKSFTIFSRILIGKSFATAYLNLKDNIWQNLNFLRSGDTVEFCRRITKESPEKVFALAEALLLYYFRNRFLRGLIIGTIAALLSVIPTFLLYNQNLLINEQTNLLAKQQSSVDLQTELLKNQVAISERQLLVEQQPEIDQSVSAALKNFDDIKMVDMDYIRRITEAISSLNPTRSRNHLSTIRNLISKCETSESEFKKIPDKFDLLTKDAQSQLNINNLNFVQRYEMQYEYLSAILLAKLLESKFPGELPTSRERVIYGLDLTFCNLKQADLSKITLFKCKVHIPVAGASKQPRIIN